MRLAYRAWHVANCECGGNVQALKNRDIKKLQVTRAGDEADGVDQTLLETDTIKSLLNTTSQLRFGSQCSRSAECSSNFCVGGFCCAKKQTGAQSMVCATVEETACASKVGLAKLVTVTQIRLGYPSRLKAN